MKTTFYEQGECASISVAPELEIRRLAELALASGRSSDWGKLGSELMISGGADVLALKSGFFPLQLSETRA